MVMIYDKYTFAKMSPELLNQWIYWYKNKLVGSAIFTKNDTFLSKLISYVESIGKKADFKPSHVGSIVEKEGNLYVFNMMPPRASMTPLANFLLYSEDDYKLVIRNFELNTKMFSANIIFHLGEFYAYLSALRSVITKRRTKYVRHCSEMHVTELQKQDLFTDFNPECTPLELYELLTEEYNYGQRKSD